MSALQSFANWISLRLVGMKLLSLVLDLGVTGCSASSSLRSSSLPPKLKSCSMFSIDLVFTLRRWVKGEK